MKMNLLKLHCSPKVYLTAVALILLGTSTSAAHADTLQFDFHGKDTSAVAAGDIDVTFKFTGETQAANLNVSAVEIVVIDGASTATNLFAALGMYQLKPGTKSIPFPVNGKPSRSTSFTITNGRDTELPGNVWKLDITGTAASLRTHGDAMDVVFKGTLKPKLDTAAAEESKTMYIIGGIVGCATIGTGIYLLMENSKRKARRRKRRRSLLVNDTDTKTSDGS
jgi:hypothetical protein